MQNQPCCSHTLLCHQLSSDRLHFLSFPDQRKTHQRNIPLVCEYAPALLRHQLPRELLHFLRFLPFAFQQQVAHPPAGLQRLPQRRVGGQGAGHIWRRGWPAKQVPSSVRGLQHALNMVPGCARYADSG